MRLTDCPRPAFDTGISAHLGNETISTGDVDLALRMGGRWFIYLHIANDVWGITRYIVDHGGIPIMRLYALFPNGPQGTTLADMLHNYHAAGGVYVKLWNETNNGYENADGTPDATRYAQMLMQTIEETLTAGCIPVVGNLSPGGDWYDYAYWCTVLDYWRLNNYDPFNRTGLAAVVGVHNYCSNKPLAWGAGGPAAWPPGSAQDNIGFRNWEWYHAAVQERFGVSVPVMCTEGGPRLGDQALPYVARTGPAEHRQIAVDIADFVQQGQAPEWLLNVSGFWTWGWQSNFDADNWYGGPLEATKQAFESYAWHARPTTAPTEPPIEPSPPLPPPLPLPPTTRRWRLVSQRRLSGAENHGQHNIFFLTRDGQGQPISSVTIRVAWPDGYYELVTDANGRGDFPMYPGTYEACVAIPGVTSDIATGLRTDIWEDNPEDGNSYGHYSYDVVFEQEAEQMDVDWPGATWLGSPNYNAGRTEQGVRLFVLHWTVGPLSGATACFQNGDNDQPGGRASAHYVLDRDGRWYQYVKEANTAWHAGVFGANLISIGIEVVAWPDMPPTEEQYRTLAEYLRFKCQEYGLTLDRGSIIGHKEVPDDGSPTGVVQTACPGLLSVDRVVLLAQGVPVDLERGVRNFAWNHLYPGGGIAYNADFAFPQQAARLGMNLPVTNEMDFDYLGITYRLQGFIGGILYTEKGNWANIRRLSWHE